MPGGEQVNFENAQVTGIVTGPPEPLGSPTINRVFVCSGTAVFQLDVSEQIIFFKVPFDSAGTPYEIDSRFYRSANVSLFSQSANLVINSYRFFPETRDNPVPPEGSPQITSISIEASVTAGDLSGNPFRIGYVVAVSASVSPTCAIFPGPFGINFNVRPGASTPITQFGAATDLIGGPNRFTWGEAREAGPIATRTDPLPYDPTNTFAHFQFTPEFPNIDDPNPNPHRFSDSTTLVLRIDNDLYSINTSCTLPVSFHAIVS
jgi:hypothetical protein